MKKICNLSKQQRNFLYKIEETIKNNFIDIILKSIKTDINKEDVYHNFKLINNLLIDSKIDIYDINNILQYYCRDHKMINFIRKLIFYKNRFILLDAISSTKWKTCVKNLIITCDKQFNDKCKYKEVEGSLLNVLKKDMNNWLGFWSIIDFTDKNTIINIDIIDSSDLNQLHKFMMEDYNKKNIKDKDLILID